eukprot:14190209-Heterocapsa_arctica.AAC.1
MQEGIKPTGNESEQDKEMQVQQHIAGTESKKEDEVYAQEEHRMEDDTHDTHILGEHAENEKETAESDEVEQNTVKNADQT